MSTFRALAPSNPQNQSSSSSPSKHGEFIGESSTSGGTSGGASGGNGAAGGGGGGSGGDVPRRRRVAGNVSLMACNECRHARQKVRLDYTHGHFVRLGRAIACQSGTMRLILTIHLLYSVV